MLQRLGFSDSVIMHRGDLDGSIEMLAKPYQVQHPGVAGAGAILDEQQESKRVQA